jgi:hypothetical protein
MKSLYKSLKSIKKPLSKYQSGGAYQSYTYIPETISQLPNVGMGVPMIGVEDIAQTKRTEAPDLSSLLDKDMLKELYGKGHTAAVDAYIAQKQQKINQLDNMNYMALKTNKGKRLMRDATVQPDEINTLLRQQKETEEQWKSAESRKAQGSVMAKDGKVIVWDKTLNKYNEVPYATYLLDRNKPDSIYGNLMTVGEFKTEFDYKGSVTNPDLNKTIGYVKGMSEVQDKVVKLLSHIETSGSKSDNTLLSVFGQVASGQIAAGTQRNAGGRETNEGPKGQVQAFKNAIFGYIDEADWDAVKSQILNDQLSGRIAVSGINLNEGVKDNMSEEEKAQLMNWNLEVAAIKRLQDYGNAKKTTKTESLTAQNIDMGYSNLHSGRGAGGQELTEEIGLHQAHGNGLMNQEMQEFVVDGVKFKALASTVKGALGMQDKNGKIMPLQMLQNSDWGKSAEAGSTVNAGMYGANIQLPINNVVLSTTNFNSSMLYLPTDKEAAKTYLKIKESVFDKEPQKYNTFTAEGQQNVKDYLVRQGAPQDLTFQKFNVATVNYVDTDGKIDEDTSQSLGFKYVGKASDRDNSLAQQAIKGASYELNPDGTPNYKVKTPIGTHIGVTDEGKVETQWTGRTDAKVYETKVFLPVNDQHSQRLTDGLKSNVSKQSVHISNMTQGPGGAGINADQYQYRIPTGQTTYPGANGPAPIFSPSSSYGAWGNPEQQ